MANIKDFIKKIGDESVSLEEQQQALAQVEKTIVEAKAKREESIGKNVDLVISALKNIESKLESKLVELNNTPAKQGVQGQQGPAGRDGRDGKDGYTGRDGKDGVDGKDGKDGEDGVSVADAQIDFDGSLLITLSDGREIDAGTVIPLDVAKQIHSVSTNGGGTSQPVLDAIASLQAQINTLTGIDGVLGSMAQQDANAVAITGGSITGITDLAIADGGTGASNASGARTNLGLGTISTQAASSVAITGGTIDNTVIGGTTPAAGTFTTITGQTEVLKGTGQNLTIQSQTFANAAWGKSNTSITSSTATAPDSTATACTLTEDTATSLHYINQPARAIAASTPITLSAYVKANGRNFCALYEGSVGQGKYFSISAGGGGSVLGNFIGTPTSAALTYVGNDWYRVSIVVTSTSTFTLGIYLSTDGTSFTYTGNGTSGINIWGAQTEIGSTLNTYVPTTTTAVYGTPTLSFSGVAGLGLESNGALYVSPAGTGALQAQATTSTTAGGNARGANAVDWQTSRSGATRVASGAQSTVSGGDNNGATAVNSTVAGGTNNVASGTQSFIGSGNGNVTTNPYSNVIGGYGNTAAGYYNFIGAGYTNSGTASAAVTTQSGTMNGTTAVTLSGSNASIKVGQYITGTSIAAFTYVAAISGTSLTLSQNASGSSTSTLSFYTPHGVVVGGGNNQATGSYSFIGGGGDAGTAANRNVASGDWSFVGGGRNNTASGSGSFVGGGGVYPTINNTYPNTASGTASAIVGGLTNSASNDASFIGGGQQNSANASYSAILGGAFGTTRSIIGNHAFSACYAPIAFALGVSQSALLILGTQTTDATATVLRSNTGAAGSTNQVILPNNSAYYFKVSVISGVTGGGNTKAWTLEGAIKRGAGVGTTAIVGSVTTTVVAADAGASAWTVTATADTTNGGLAITFTGQASTTIRTVARVNTTEMTY